MYTWYCCRAPKDDLNRVVIRVRTSTTASSSSCLGGGVCSGGSCTTWVLETSIGNTSPSSSSVKSVMGRSSVDGRESLLLLLVSSIFGGFVTSLVVMQYGRGCDGESRWYRAGPGSFDLLVGTIFCLVLSLSTFAQVSRYPLRELPSLQLLLGKYMDTEENDERQHVGEEGDQIMQEGDDDRQVEDEEMQV